MSIKTRGAGEASKVWQCGQCEATHDYKADAQTCCRPDVNSVFQCDACRDIFTDEDEAINCCLPACKDCGDAFDPEADDVTDTDFCAWHQPEPEEGDQKYDASKDDRATEQYGRDFV